MTQKPAETRMGSGKGNPEYWVAVVKPGRIMFEISGVPRERAEEALRRAAMKMPMDCRRAFVPMQAIRKSHAPVRAFVGRRNEAGRGCGEEDAGSEGRPSDVARKRVKDAARSRDEQLERRCTHRSGEILRFQEAVGKLTATSRIRQIRKDIARIHTIRTERVMDAALARSARTSAPR